jgi:hypothetical protein
VRTRLPSPGATRGSRDPLAVAQRRRLATVGVRLIVRHVREAVEPQRTMEPRDREEQKARRPREPRVPAEKAVEHLQALGDALRLAEEGSGREMVARSVFERLEASGLRELKVHLTEGARAHAFAGAVPPRNGRGGQSSGRGSHEAGGIGPPPRPRRRSRPTPARPASAVHSGRRRTRGADVASPSSKQRRPVAVNPAGLLHEQPRVRRRGHRASALRGGARGRDKRGQLSVRSGARSQVQPRPPRGAIRQEVGQGRRDEADDDRAEHGRHERVQAEVRGERGEPESERERIGDEREDE